MKILQIAPPVLPIGRVGGAERVIKDLDKSFTRLGHDSFVICSEDSKIAGKKLSPIKESIWLSNRELDEKELEIEMGKYCNDVIKYINNINPDIVHDHMGFVKSEAFQNSGNLSPILSTLHASANYRNTMGYKNVAKRSNGNRVFFNTVSNSQREIFSSITDVDFVVYNGTDVDEFPFSADKMNFVFFMSSIYPEKGTETAINVASELNKKIVVAGPVHLLDDDSKNRKIRTYWENSIKPRIDFWGDSSNPENSLKEFLRSNKEVMYTGELGETEKRHFYQNASAFYAPVDLDEAFGLTIIEANSCGTPVVAYSRGAIPEIISHGETGYQVNPQNILNFIDFASRTDEISPFACREHVRKNFSLERQVNNYLETYKKIIEKSKN